MLDAKGGAEMILYLSADGIVKFFSLDALNNSLVRQVLPATFPIGLMVKIIPLIG